MHSFGSLDEDRTMMCLVFLLLKFKLDLKASQTGAVNTAAAVMSGKNRLTILHMMRITSMKPSSHSTTPDIMTNNKLQTTASVLTF